MELNNQLLTDYRKTTNRLAPIRPEILEGKTIKIPKVQFSEIHSGNVYVTVNFLDDKPYEIFINSPDVTMHHVIFQDTLSRLTSTAFRHGIPAAFIIEQLQKIKGCDINKLPLKVAYALTKLLGATNLELLEGMKCKYCNSTNIVFTEGCVNCRDCGHSHCG